MHMYVDTYACMYACMYVGAWGITHYACTHTCNHRIACMCALSMCPSCICKDVDMGAAKTICSRNGHLHEENTQPFEKLRGTITVHVSDNELISRENRKRLRLLTLRSQNSGLSLAPPC